MELGRARPTFFEQSVRVPGLQPIIGNLKLLAAEGVDTFRDPVPFHPDISIGPSSDLVRREQRSAGQLVKPHPRALLAA